MTRRDFLAGTGALSTLFLSGIPAAQAKETHEAAISKEKLQKATDATFDCIKTGEACLSFCNERLAQGDTSMKNCHKTIQNMLAACTAFSKIGSYATAKPETIRHLAVVCSDLCKDCHDACKVHAEHHAVCKACMTSCEQCSSACDEIKA